MQGSIGCHLTKCHSRAGSKQSTKPVEDPSPSDPAIRSPGDDLSCQPVLFAAGTGAVEAATKHHVHTVRNETGSVAEAVVTCVVPQGANPPRTNLPYPETVLSERRRRASGKQQEHELRAFRLQSWRGLPRSSVS